MAETFDSEPTPSTADLQSMVTQEDPPEEEVLVPESSVPGKI